MTILLKRGVFHSLLILTPSDLQRVSLGAEAYLCLDSSTRSQVRVLSSPIRSPEGTVRF